MSNISVPPSHLYIADHSNNSLISVGGAQRSMTLTCWCLGAKPPPAITWLRNDVIVTTGVTSSSAAAAGEGGGGLWDSWSVVLVDQLSPRRGGDTYTCRCENDASTTPSEFNVRVNIHGQYIYSHDRLVIRT